MHPGLDFLKRPGGILAMIHVGALPGTPRQGEPLAAIEDRASADAATYRDAGVDAILVENMHDRPYLKGAVGPEITAAMAVIARTIARESGLPTGIQILAGANREALAAALAAGCGFIRAEGFVFGHLADEGYHDACAGELLRYRRAIGAESVAILADVKKKHSSHALTADVDIVETARAAEFFLADGIVVTGRATGEETDPGELAEVRRGVGIPVLVGSGVTEANVHLYLPHAHGLIVGSHFKAGGRWDRLVEPDRVRRFMDRVRSLRERCP